MKKLLMILITLVLAACADSGGSSGAGAAATKSLFGIWTRTDLAISMNLTGGSIGSFTLQWTLSSGHKCNSIITISGSENSGGYSVSSSVYVGGTGNGVDPGCSSLNEVGTFSKSGNVLTICTNGTNCRVWN